MGLGVKSAAVPERVNQLVAQVLAGTPLYLIEVVVNGRTINVYIDADEGVTLKQCAEVSRDLSFLLDTQEVILGTYRLNVSSPGVDRPLRMPRQYHKNIGRPLRIILHSSEVESPQTVQGRLVQVDEDGITIDVAGELKPLAFSQIEKAQVQLPW
jgi:ribosome maturation factor RimP